MTNDKFKPIFKLESNTPKTYEQFVLDNQLEQNQKTADSYQTELDSGSSINIPRGYGPCVSYGCSHDRPTILEQFRKAETLRSELQGAATGSLANFGTRFKEYDRAWENYRSFVASHIAGSKELKELKLSGSLAFIKMPGVSYANDLYGESISAIAGVKDKNTMRETYNNSIVKTYNEAKEWYEKTRYELMHYPHYYD